MAFSAIPNVFSPAPNVFANINLVIGAGGEASSPREAPSSPFWIGERRGEVFLPRSLHQLVEKESLTPFHKLRVCYFLFHGSNRTLFLRMFYRVKNNDISGIQAIIYLHSHLQILFGLLWPLCLTNCQQRCSRPYTYSIDRNDSYRNGWKLCFCTTVHGKNRVNIKYIHQRPQIR